MNHPLALAQRYLNDSLITPPAKSNAMKSLAVDVLVFEYTTDASDKHLLEKMRSMV